MGGRRKGSWGRFGGPKGVLVTFREDTRLAAMGLPDWSVQQGEVEVGRIQGHVRGNMDQPVLVSAVLEARDHGNTRGSQVREQSSVKGMNESGTTSESWEK